jgi:hypothetical protein
VCPDPLKHRPQDVAVVKRSIQTLLVLRDGKDEDIKFVEELRQRSAEVDAVYRRLDAWIEEGD